jgi:hypothetical protein
VLPCLVGNVSGYRSKPVAETLTSAGDDAHGRGARTERFEELPIDAVLAHQVFRWGDVLLIGWFSRSNYPNAGQSDQ